jgi:hypothetical protein
MNFIRGRSQLSIPSVYQPKVGRLDLYTGSNNYKFTIKDRLASLRIITGRAREGAHPSTRVNLDALARNQ